MTKIREEVFRNFSGGVNWRDHPSELAQNEIPYALNVTVDERGEAMKRLGYLDRYGAAVGTGVVSNLFDWATQNKVVAQVGTGIHIDGGSAIHNFSTSARVTFSEHNSMLTMSHPVDGIKFWNGSSISSPTGSPPTTVGPCAVWQNRLWVADVGSPRVFFSDIGSVNFTSTSWVDIKEKDSAPIVAMAGAGGQDISGRPGLLLFKKDSAYRIHDSNTGAYTTIDPSVGCGSNIGAISAYGRTYTVSTKGIFWTDGLAPMAEQSQLISPLFHVDQINTSRPDLFAAGKHQDRLYFSFPKAGETANTLVMEVHPIQNWTMPHTNAASCYASLRNGTDMVMGSPTTNRIYNHNTTGGDNGADIASSLQTNWIEPRGGNLTRVRRARFVGHGTFDAGLWKDWNRGPAGLILPVSIMGDAMGWNEGEDWDEGHLWGPTSFQGHQDFWSLGTYRAVSIRIDETSDLVSTGRDFLTGLSSPEAGAWSLSHINLLVFDLGNY